MFETQKCTIVNVSAHSKKWCEDSDKAVWLYCLSVTVSPLCLVSNYIQCSYFQRYSVPQNYQGPTNGGAKCTTGIFLPILVCATLTAPVVRKCNVLSSLKICFTLPRASAEQFQSSERVWDNPTKPLGTLSSQLSAAITSVLDVNTHALICATHCR